MAASDTTGEAGGPSSARNDGLRRHEDGRTRCWWCGDDPGYIDYHDHEWGVPVHDDRRLFEKICLEGFQAGLSWLTILRKREAFRIAFAGFDPEIVARYGEPEISRLLEDRGIVRNRAKIEATIANARATLELAASEGSLDRFIWSFAPERSPAPRRIADVPASTPAAAALSTALRQRGFRYVGPVTAYAFMQAMGLVDDHLVGCDARADP